MNSILDILIERLPQGLEVVRVRDRSKYNHYQLLFRYKGFEVEHTLSKTCAPGCAEQICDFLIHTVMMALSIKMKDHELSQKWHAQCRGISTRPDKPAIPGLSPHQQLVGKTFYRDHCRMFCIAAHQDAVLILMHGESNQPTNYVVCHRPKIADGTLVWAAGDYFTIPNYQHSGRSNPMSAALADAMNCLLDSTILEFCFDPIEDEPGNQSVYVLVYGALSSEELAKLEDSLSSHLESMESCGFVGLVEDVMKAQATVSFRILNPDHTFHI